MPSWKWFLERINCYSEWQLYGAMFPIGGIWGLVTKVLKWEWFCLQSLLVMHWWIFASYLCMLGWEDLKVLFPRRKSLSWVDRAKIIKLEAMAANQLAKLFAPRDQQTRIEDITLADYWLITRRKCSCCDTSEQRGICFGNKAMMCWHKLSNLLIRVSYTLLFSTSHSVIQYQ